VSLRAQQRESGLDDGQGAQHVRLEVCTSIFQARFLDCAYEAVPGITQDHVEVPETLVGLIDSLENCIPFSDIERQCQYGATQGKLRLDPYSGEVFVVKRVDSSVIVNEHDAISGFTCAKVFECVIHF
jgi:hypothetical protein